MSTPPRIRLYGFIAEKARVAVLLRHGPNGLWRMIRWDLARDRFERGQWFKGTIYLPRCDLSPDGEYFVALLAKHWRWGEDKIWTALSRPPYFTAQALNFEKAYAPVGAIFIDRAPTVPDKWICAKNFSPPKTLVRRNWRDPERLQGERRAVRDSRFYWRHKAERLIRNGPHGWRIVATLSSAGVHAALSLEHGRGHICTLRDVDWLEFDHNNDLLYSDHGRLFRLGHHALLRAAGDGGLDWPTLAGRARLVADFSQDKFKDVRAPYIGVSIRAPLPPDRSTPLDRVTRDDRRAARKSRARAGRADRNRPASRRRPR